MSVPDLEISHEKFIDKVSLILGESGTGKSVIIVDMLHALRPHIDQILVFAPTDRQNHTYDGGIVPLPFIHYTITPQLLTSIWSRQEALASVYTRSNDKKILDQLFRKIPSARRQMVESAITEVTNRLKNSERELVNSGLDEAQIKSKVTDLRAECDKFLLQVHKTFITRETEYLAKLDLSEDETFALKYHGMNPRIVIIFDDCTDLIKKYSMNEVMQKIFYQGRHSFITAILAVHTDKALNAELKKNAAVTIFTEQPCASGYITRPSTNLDKESQARALNACKIAFGDPTRPFQKLAYVRHEKKYYKFCAERRSGFSFGSSIVKTFGHHAAADKGKVSADNQFIGQF
jgi:hypothetical protein